MNIFEAAAFAGGVVGAAAGPIWGYSAFGVPGALLGLPVGFVVGFYFPTFLILVVIAVYILVTEGPRGLPAIFWGRRAEPPGSTKTSRR